MGYNIKNRKIIDNKYRETAINPNLSNIVRTYNIKFVTVPVNEHTYLDKIAYEYYGDESKWYVICLFNNIIDPLRDLEDKVELLIPLNLSDWEDRL